MDHTIGFEKGIPFLALLSCLIAPPPALAAGVHAIFDLSAPDRCPFPSDRFTVADSDQLTGRRVELPLPDCKSLPSDCDDLAVVNELDGFGLQPRLGIPFSGAIDPKSVSSSNVFLVALGDVVGGDGFGEAEGVNQLVWDPSSNTLYAESDQLLRQHSRYALIVTDGVRDSAGDAVEAGDFGRFRHDLNFGQTRDRELKAYRKALLEAIDVSGIPPPNVVAASVFTTQSVTAVLEKIRGQLKAAAPAPARFDIVMSGPRTHAVFDVADILPDSILPRPPRESGIFVSRETRSNFTLAQFPQTVVPRSALDIVPGAVARIAFGVFDSPDYEKPAKFIPQVKTRTGVPAAQGSNQIYFNLFLPSETLGRKPPWPVAIFNHGLASNKEAGAFATASRMAEHGIATIAINSPGHGQGVRGFLTIATHSEGKFVLPAGGRGIDQNNDGAIDTDEGSLVAAGPRAIIYGRDGYLQTVIDTMQLVRVIQQGIDVDEDGIADLDPSRIYYFGQSRGGIVGSIFLAVEPDVFVGAMNVPGGPIIDVGRLNPGPALRNRVTQFLSARTPTLLNALPILPPLDGFNENMPLRNQPVVVNDVPGAIELQTLFDRLRWVQQSGDPVAYAPHLRERPLDGMPSKDILIQFARGDMTVPNPTTTALLRAGNLADRATLYRYDLLYPSLPVGTAKNPHNFMPNLTVPATFPQRDLAQTQIAVFFESGGGETIDPDGDGKIFETPVKPPLPEDVGFLQ